MLFAKLIAENCKNEDFAKDFEITNDHIAHINN
jgi:hypothetical protein